jgi:hypothetical protein
MNKHYLRESDYEERDYYFPEKPPLMQRWAVKLLCYAFVLSLVYSLAQAAPISITTKGRYVVTCEGQTAAVSSHNIDTEAYESAATYASTKGGKAKCTVTPPFKELLIDIGSAAPPPTCTIPQPVTSQPMTCPSGTTGQWTQSRTVTAAAYPACWTVGAWTPATVPAGSCVTPPLSAPTVTAVVQPGTNPGRYNVVLTWPAVTRATAYEVERCEGAGCTSFTALASVSVLEYRNSNLPSGFTFRYRVRPAEGQQLGPWSAIVTAQTPTTGTATVSWVGPTQYVDNSPLNPITDLTGYRVLYGESAASLTRSIDVPSTATSAAITGLTPGTWYFGVQALVSYGASATSAIANKAVQ